MFEIKRVGEHQIKVRSKADGKTVISFDASSCGGVTKIAQRDDLLFVTCADNKDRVFSLGDGSLVSEPRKCDLTNEEKKKRKKQYLNRLANGHVKKSEDVED